MMNSYRGAKAAILDCLKTNVGKPVSSQLLQEQAGIRSWTRRIRELRQDGWDIEETNQGSLYTLKSLSPDPKRVKRLAISEKLRYQVLHRDNSKCNRCGATPDDGVKLQIDHKVPVEWGGDTVLDNLWTLCEVCNRGKKHWFTDLDSNIMKTITALLSARDRIRAYFQHSQGRRVTKTELVVVSGIVQYARRIRELRNEEQMKIEAIGSAGDYIYHGDG